MTLSIQSGLSQLAAAFPSYPVTGVPVIEGLHLKSFLSMAGPDMIAIGISPAATEARKVLETKGNFRYSYLEVPDDIAANCLYINGTLVHVSKEAFPNSSEIFKELPTARKVALSTTELNKVDGCLTCCCVLIWMSTLYIFEWVFCTYLNEYSVHIWMSTLYIFEWVPVHIWMSTLYIFEWVPVHIWMSTPYIFEWVLCTYLNEHSVHICSVLCGWVYPCQFFPLWHQSNNNQIVLKLGSNVSATIPWPSSVQYRQYS